MFTVPVQILAYCANWIAAGWFNAFLVCTIGYLVIVKIVLIRRLYTVTDNAAVRRIPMLATTPQIGHRLDLDTSRRSPETVAQIPRARPPASSASNADTSAQPRRPVCQLPVAAATNTLPSELAELAALEWSSVDCQNQQGCTRTADYVVEYHVIDHCLDNGTNALGNIVEIVCQTCLAFLQITIEIHIDRLISQGRDLRCLACGKPLLLPSDILRSVIPLHETVRAGSAGPSQADTSAKFVHPSGLVLSSPDTQSPAVCHARWRRTENIRPKDH